MKTNVPNQAHHHKYRNFDAVTEYCHCVLLLHSVDSLGSFLASSQWLTNFPQHRQLCTQIVNIVRWNCCANGNGKCRFVSSNARKFNRIK